MSGSPSSTPASQTRSLSPSDESRFVPYSSVMGSSSVLERHFAAATNSEPAHPLVEVNDPTEMPAVMDDEKSVGLVGATICFTPKSSPVSSPNWKGTNTSGVNAITTVCSLNSGSNNYIGSLHEDPVDHISMKSIMKSSAVQIASSLDGRSITEYEVLDGMHSRGTIEYEDLISEDGSGEHKYAQSKTNTKGEGIEHRSQNLSGSIASPSLNGAGYDDLTLPTLASPFRYFKTSPSDEKHAPGESEEQSLLSRESNNVTLNPRDTVVEYKQTHGGSINSSPIDDRPLNTFMTLQNFWESHATLSSMTKSMVLRVLGTQTPDVPENDKAGVDTENVAVAAAPTMSTDMEGGKSSEVKVKSATANPNNPFAFEEELPENNSNGGDSNGTTLAVNENVNGARMDSLNDVMGIIAKWRLVISTILSAPASLCFLVIFIYVFNFLPTPGNDVIQEEFANLPQHEIIAIPSEEQSFEEDVINEVTYKFEGFWLTVSTMLTLMLGAFVLKSKTKASSPVEPQLELSTSHVTGIWCEEEHRQFLEGYNIHGNKWKMVSTFVPTRSDTQVRAHGTYWLKIRSPTKMTRARVVATPTPTNSPDNPVKKENSPSSVSSGKSTPTKSNLSTDAKTPVASMKERPQPIKGILSVKDRNRSSKHVTPKSDHKPRKSTTKQGPKLEPVKRVRIQTA